MFSKKVSKRLEVHKKVILQVVKSGRSGEQIMATIRKLSHKAIPDLEKHLLRCAYREELCRLVASKGVKLPHNPKRQVLLISKKNPEIVMVGN